MANSTDRYQSQGGISRRMSYRLRAEYDEGREKTLKSKVGSGKDFGAAGGGVQIRSHHQGDESGRQGADE